MFKTLSLILIMTFSTKVLADCKPVTPIQAGEVAPCTGYIFTPAKELELRQMNEDYKFSQEQIKLYLQQKELYKQELEVSNKIAEKEAAKAEIWRQAAEDSTTQYVKLEEARTTRDYLFLLAGIGLTVLSAWSIGQASK